MEPPPAEDTLGAVIHAMRRIEARATDAGRRRGQVLEECREVLGAASMAICHLRNNGELAILGLAGPPPDAATVRDIIASVPIRSRDWFSSIRHGVTRDLAIAGRGSDLVYALLAPDAEAWVEDFVAFVSERFIHSSTPPVQIGESTTRGLTLPPEMVVGPSPAMRALLHQMSATVGSGRDVVLSGETGTGKEILARVVHASGPTRGGPFVAINCAAIPGELLEAELFGVERGVATGVDPRTGLFMEADGGSMFLDEIAELPEKLQAKLLRVLQEREVLALGAKRPRKISVRIISASNRNLAGLVAEGRFRADLYYRLRGLEFHAPPLRSRSEDIPMLAVEFLTRAADDYGKSIAGITSEALDLLRTYSWPGNVRELQSEIHRAVLLCQPHDSIDTGHFPLLRPAPAALEKPEIQSAPLDSSVLTLRERLETVEREEIVRALRASRGNRSIAAKTLGITRNGLTHKLRRLGIEVTR